MTTAQSPIAATAAVLNEADIDLRVFSYQRQEQHEKGLIHRPHGTEGYLLAFFITPVAIHVRGIEQQHPAMTCYVWEPGERQCFGNLHKRWNYSWVNLDGLCLRELLSSFAIPSGQPLSLSDASVTEVFFQGVQEEFRRHLHPSEQALYLLLAYWLLDISRGQRAPDMPPDWLAVREYLDAHFTEHLSLTRLAEEFHQSVSQFCHEFKRHFQTTILEYLNEKRMRQAAILLRDHNLSIANIAYQSGYTDRRYFSLQFKHHYHLSPREMRNSISGETARAQKAEERHSRELALLLREGWLPIVEHDFSATRELDARFTPYKYYDEKTHRLFRDHELASIEEGMLCLRPEHRHPWMELCWNEPVNEEVKLEVTIANTLPEGPDVALSVSGDLHSGYRMRVFGYNYLAFETATSGEWMLLHFSRITLDPGAPYYHLSLWRAFNVFYAEVNGQRILEYPESIAFYGERHRTFAIGGMGHATSRTRILSLRAFQRKLPRYLDMPRAGAGVVAPRTCAGGRRLVPAYRAGTGRNGLARRDALFVGTGGAGGAKRRGVAAGHARGRQSVPLACLAAISGISERARRHGRRGDYRASVSRTAAGGSNPLARGA